MEIVETTGGTVRIEQGPLGGGGRLTWRDAGRGDRLVLGLPVDEESRYLILFHGRLRSGR